MWFRQCNIIRNVYLNQKGEKMFKKIIIISILSSTSFSLVQGALFHVKNNGSRSVSIAFDIYQRDNRTKFIQVLTANNIKPGETRLVSAGGNRCAKFISLFDGEPDVPGYDTTKYNTDQGDFNNEGKVAVTICDDATITLTTKAAPGVSGTVQWHINAPVVN